MTAQDSAFEILLVEDDDGDAILVEEGLPVRAGARRLTRAVDGVAALDLLRGPTGYRPDLIILDLNMPRMNGHELLAILKKDPDLLAIPVVVLTSSHDPGNIIDAYRNHANAYLTKPGGLDAFVQSMRTLDSFFQLTTRLPRPVHDLEPHAPSATSSLPDS